MNSEFWADMSTAGNGHAVMSESDKQGDMRKRAEQDSSIPDI